MEQLKPSAIYEDLLQELGEGNYQQAIEDASGLIAIAHMMDEFKYVLLGKYLLGIAYYYSYDYRNSIDKYMELLNILLEVEMDLEAIGLEPDFYDKVRYGMALDMYHLGDLDGGAIIIDQLLTESKSVQVIYDSIILLGIIYLMMYEVRHELGFLATTLEMYLTLLEEGDLAEEKEAMLYNNLAILFIHRGQYDKAQDMLNHSFMRGTSPLELASLFNENARIHLLTEKYNKGEKILDKARGYLKDCDDPLERSYHLFLRGLLNKPESKIKALQLFEKSSHLAKKYNDLPGQIRVYEELASLYQELGYEDNLDYLIELKNLKKKISPVKEVIEWKDRWRDIKDHVTPGQTLS